jgi:hypothetical protein
VQEGEEALVSVSIVELTPSLNNRAEKIFENSSLATGAVSSALHKTAMALVA